MCCKQRCQDDESYDVLYTEKMPSQEGGGDEEKAAVSSSAAPAASSRVMTSDFSPREHSVTM